MRAEIELPQPQLYGTSYLLVRNTPRGRMLQSRQRNVTMFCQENTDMAIIHSVGKMKDGELRWQDVPVRAYSPQHSGADRATRQGLIGPDENSPHFHMRYFAVQAGGHTSLDQHAHDHGVYVLHGRARLRLGSSEYEISTGDVIYIPGNEIHQFFTLGDEPFGFLCV